MSKSILVVDDSQYSRRTLCDILENAGYNIVGQAADGESAIDMALDLDPDVITLDNILPDMVGLQIVKVLKKEEKIRATIIMISSVGQQSVIDRGIANGAYDYITKPFTSQDIINAIEKSTPADV